MPLHVFHIVDESGERTGESFEHFFRKQSDVKNELTSSDGRRAVRGISAPARTSASWSGAAGTFGGVNGVYNRGLGCRVSSYAEMDRIAEARGLVRVDDLGTHAFDELLEKKERYDSHIDSIAKSQETWS